MVKRGFPLFVAKRKSCNTGASFDHCTVRSLHPGSCTVLEGYCNEEQQRKGHNVASVTERNQAIARLVARSNLPFQAIDSDDFRCLLPRENHAIPEPTSAVIRSEQDLKSHDLTLLQLIKNRVLDTATYLSMDELVMRLSDRYDLFRSHNLVFKARVPRSILPSLGGWSPTVSITFVDRVIEM
ncbi:unnamed protein product, partial [Mesorhabditis belari]|uniref:Uncharacterized protein n=1 Tax=Mesorhabditis belari TaxID=2138241 RepID=A0AAF3EUK3_9BILA